MLHVQEVSARGIRQKVEQTKHPRGNVGTSAVTDDVGPRGQLHDERDKVQKRCETSVDKFRQDPVDGQIQHLTDAQQVHEAPQDGRNERGDHDEQEPVGSTEQCRGGAGHADDAKDQLHQLQYSGNRREVVHVELDPVEAVVRLGLGLAGGTRWRRLALVNRNDRFRHHGFRSWLRWLVRSLHSHLTLQPATTLLTFSSNTRRLTRSAQSVLLFQAAV